MRYLRLKQILSMTSVLLTLAMSGAVIAPVAGAADEPTTVMTVNDSEVGDVPFTFSFGAGWVHEGGYPDRFVGGDEHWTTTAQFGQDYPSFTFRFVGSSVALYGHKVPAGGMADVTVDGKPAGRIDYYHPSRIEKTLLWQSETLTYGEHAVTVRLVAEKNPAAGDTHEASIDYAEVRTAETLPVTGVAAGVESLLLEPGMAYPLTYTLLPAYATEKPAITFTSADKSVATVDRDGRITAVAPGKTTVTLAPADGRCSDTVAVTVREPVGGDLVAVAGSTNVHTRQDGYHDRLASLDLSATALSVTAWQADIATAKIDLLTKGEAIRGIRATAGTLKNHYGDVLDATVTILPVRDTLAHDTGHLIPDVIGGDATLDLPAGAVGSLWLRMETPAGALPGIYRTDVTVTADGGHESKLSLSVEVIGLARPQNTAALELWQYPYSANRYYSGKTTEAYFGQGVEALWHTHLDPAYTDALRSQIELYAAAGGRSVTVTVTEDPWNSQTPDPYPSMIKWTRERDGSFSFDYTDLDYWVALNESCGVDGAIMSFSMADWANRVTYYDVRTSSVRSEQLTPGSERWRSVWTAFLTDYMAHTTEMGWFDRTYMAMDERPAELVEQVLYIVESVRNPEGKCFKTALAVFSFETEHLFDRITDLSLAIYMTPEKLVDITAHRRSLGLTTTLYTCGAQYSALENPPMESLYTLWYCEKMGADGFLRWALDAFNDDPLRTSAHRLFAAGDIYLFYPDEKTAENPAARLSPRFEKLAEGCRDISKLRYLASLSDENTAATRKILGGIRSASHDVTGAQDDLNALARRVALQQLLEVAAALPETPELRANMSLAESCLSDVNTAAATVADITCTFARYIARATASETETAAESAASPAETTAPGASENGCASTVAPVAPALLAVATAALVCRRRDPESRRNRRKH